MSLILIRALKPERFPEASRRYVLDVPATDALLVIQVEKGIDSNKTKHTFYCLKVGISPNSPFSFEI